jgi:hypothetical protein
VIDPDILRFFPLVKARCSGISVGPVVQDVKMKHMTYITHNDPDRLLQTN